MFTKADNKGIVVVLIYVDDIVITSNNQSGIEALKRHLSKEFDIKELGKLRYFLGVEVARSHKGLFLSQRKYVMDLLKETGMLGVRPANIPMEYNSKFILDNTPLHDVGQFQRLVGRCIFLTNTRPDIAYTFSYISQFYAETNSMAYGANKSSSTVFESQTCEGNFNEK